MCIKLLLKAGARWRLFDVGWFDCEVTSFSGSQPPVIRAFREFYKVGLLCGGAVSNVVHQSAQFELDSAQH